MTLPSTPLQKPSPKAPEALEGLQKPQGARNLQGLQGASSSRGASRGQGLFRAFQARQSLSILCTCKTPPRSQKERASILEASTQSLHKALQNTAQASTSSSQSLQKACALDSTLFELNVVGTVKGLERRWAVGYRPSTPCRPAPA